MFPLRPIHRQSANCGTTVVETALVLPVFLILVFSLLAFSHALMVKNVLRGACRPAARMAPTGGSSTGEVEAYVRQQIGSAIRPEAVNVFVKDASAFDQGGGTSTAGADLENLPSINLETAESRQLFMVRARVNYADVALVPMPFSAGVVLEGQAFTRME